MAFWLISSSSELKHIFYHINRVGVRIGPALAFCSHNLTAHVGPLYERAEADRLFLLMCENRQDGLYKGFIHRLKLLKRQAYGRAGVALLTQRMLFHPSDPTFRLTLMTNRPISEKAQDHRSKSPRLPTSVPL